MIDEKRKSFTFPSTGVTVAIKPVSMVALMMQIKREQPAPKPPLVKVNIAGTETQERNYADPDYARAFNNWDQLVQVEAMERGVKRIAFLQNMTPERQAAVNEFREAFPEEYQGTSDKMVWFYEFAIGDDSDIPALVNRITKMADPSAEGVETHSNGFQPSVQTA